MTAHAGFTGKERDAETGLDYFGARYMSSAQGRFTGADPLLNSGRPWNPQTWNRYSYALNNPLKFNDPTGLYEWGACSGSQQECDNYKKQFRAALNNLKQARDSYNKKSSEYKRLDAALGAYGKENTANGVTAVGFRQTGTAGETIPAGDEKSYSVMFNTDTWKAGLDSTKYLASDVGHEGTHVADGRREIATGDVLSDFSREYRGYETSAFVFSGLFKPALSANSGTTFGGERSTNLIYGGSIIWNSSWSQVDKSNIQSRDTGITNAVQTIKGYPETTPHNPWKE